MGLDGSDDVPGKGQSSSSWILLDATGQGLIMEMDKCDIMHRVEIDARDLRILDPLLSYPSTIFSRHKLIVLNFEHIKAIITSEKVFLRDPNNENVVPIVEKLQRQLSKLSVTHQQQEQYLSALPFEFLALEVALEAICSFLAARAMELEIDAYSALDELTSKISTRSLDKVRKLKSAMKRMSARVQKIRDKLEQLLDDDNDMADLYLSRKADSASPLSGSNVSRASCGDENDMDELEQLLETYFKQIDGTLNTLTTLRKYIDYTDDYIKIQLDNHRNQLIQLDMFLATGTLCLSVYCLVAGILCMNIPYTWNDDHDYMFKWVVIVGGVFFAIMFLMITLFAGKKGLLGT
ncbi:unnamed protein product [Lathyrus sativus]|nr:unnamed protein product [Lathyrus sativus]